MAECPDGLIELKNSLKRELEDELMANSRYKEAAIKLLHYKEPSLQQILDKISADELTHWAMLEGVIESIENKCGKSD